MRMEISTVDFNGDKKSKKRKSDDTSSLPIHIALLSKFDKPIIKLPSFLFCKESESEFICYLKKHLKSDILPPFAKCYICNNFDNTAISPLDNNSAECSVYLEKIWNNIPGVFVILMQVSPNGFGVFGAFQIAFSEHTKCVSLKEQRLIFNLDINSNILSVYYNRLNEDVKNMINVTQCCTVDDIKKLNDGMTDNIDVMQSEDAVDDSLFFSDEMDKVIEGAFSIKRNKISISEMCIGNSIKTAINELANLNNLKSLIKKLSADILMPLDDYFNNDNIYKNNQFPWKEICIISMFLLCDMKRPLDDIIWKWSFYIAKKWHDLNKDSIQYNNSWHIWEDDISYIKNVLKEELEFISEIGKFKIKLQVINNDNKLLESIYLNKCTLQVHKFIIENVIAIWPHKLKDLFESLLEQSSSIDTKDDSTITGYENNTADINSNEIACLKLLEIQSTIQNYYGKSLEDMISSISIPYASEKQPTLYFFKKICSLDHPILQVNDRATFDILYEFFHDGNSDYPKHQNIQPQFTRSSSFIDNRPLMDEIDINTMPECLQGVLSEFKKMKSPPLKHTASIKFTMALFSIIRRRNNTIDNSMFAVKKWYKENGVDIDKGKFISIDSKNGNSDTSDNKKQFISNGHISSYLPDLKNYLRQIEDNAYENEHKQYGSFGSLNCPDIIAGKYQGISCPFTINNNNGHLKDIEDLIMDKCKIDKQSKEIMGSKYKLNPVNLQKNVTEWMKPLKSPITIWAKTSYLVASNINFVVNKNVPK